MVRKLLERGHLVLPAGPDARVLALTPPLTITAAQLENFAVSLDDALDEDGP
jgi:4-aminobutyrate aminotransferase-like enzyme